MGDKRMTEYLEIPVFLRNQENLQGEKIIVCDKCLMASCWHGEFMCEESFSPGAGTVEKTIKELKKLNLENSHHWKNQ